MSAPPSSVALHQALHTDLEPLETVCMHYRQAHGDAMILTQRRVIAALLKALHEMLHRNANKTRTILALAERLTLAQFRFFLLQQGSNVAEPQWRRSLA